MMRRSMRSFKAGWKASGRSTALGLADSTCIYPSELIQGSLLRLEASGQVLRGQFRRSTQHSELSIQNCRASERPSGATADCWRAFIV